MFNRKHERKTKIWKPMHRWEHKIDLKESGKCECGLNSYFSGKDLVLGFSGHANERTYSLHGKGIYLPASSLTAFKNSGPESLKINHPDNSWWTGTQLF
jgi:hypothetical protein